MLVEIEDPTGKVNEVMKILALSADCRVIVESLQVPCDIHPERAEE